MKKVKMIFSFFITVIFIFGILTTTVKGEELTPSTEQRLEFRVVSVQNVDEKDKQVIVEFWAYNMEFAGIDLNLYYDSSKLSPSDLDTNDYITEGIATDSNMFWKESVLEENLDVWFRKYLPEELQYIMTIMNSENPQSQHIYTGTNADGEDYISIKAEEDGVLLGKFSYRLFNGKVTEDTFGLQETDEQPTGIQVIIDNVDEYVDPNIFKVVLDFASDNANLSNIKVDDNNITEFDKDTTSYNVEINEIKDEIKLLPIKEDELATINVKKYVENGPYEEISLDSGGEFYNVVLNDLGEETKIIIEVTAEDGEATKQYEIVFKIPCGIVQGSLQLGDTLRESMQGSYDIYVEYIADITAYQTGDVDWNGILTQENTFEEVDLITNFGNTQSDKDDGSYELKLLPGTYDIKIEKPGFIVAVITDIIVEKDKIVELENKTLLEGDTDRSGMVVLSDVIEIVKKGDSYKGSSLYEEACDYGKKGYIALSDIISTVKNVDLYINIEKYKE